MAIRKISSDARRTLRLWNSEAMFRHLSVTVAPLDERMVEGEQTIGRMLKDGRLWELSQREPVKLMQPENPRERAAWARIVGPGDSKGDVILYQGCLYSVTRTYTGPQKRLLVMEAADKERRKWERLEAKFDSEAGRAIKEQRRRVPEDVRVAVWRRDQGKCARCGSRENLEYDHIVPLSKGGSNTVRNIELLCEKCNRAKRDEVR